MLWGLDVVIGYQVSWLLMFADYSRYTKSGGKAATAVFAGLGLPALWLMPLGWTLARIAGSDDPGTMLTAAGTGWWTAVLVALATVTTNFVNIYLSSLAWRTLVPQTTSAASVWTIGLIGTALGLLSSVWLDRFAELMVLLGSVLVPVGGVFLAHFVVLRRPVDIEAVYATDRLPRFNAERHRRVGGRLHRLQAGRADRRDAPGTRHFNDVYMALTLWHAQAPRTSAPLRHPGTLGTLDSLLHRIHIDETCVTPWFRTLEPWNVCGSSCAALVALVLAAAHGMGTNQRSEAGPQAAVNLRQDLGEPDRLVRRQNQPRRAAGDLHRPLPA